MVAHTWAENKKNMKWPPLSGCQPCSAVKRLCTAVGEAIWSEAANGKRGSVMITRPRPDWPSTQRWGEPKAARGVKLVAQILDSLSFQLNYCFMIHYRHRYETVILFSIDLPFTYLFLYLTRCACTIIGHKDAIGVNARANMYYSTYREEWGGKCDVWRPIMGSGAGGAGGGGRPPDFGGKFFNTFRPPPRFWWVL